MTTPPDAEAVARVKLLEATECGCDLCEAILDAYREAVERRVRAQYEAQLRDAEAAMRTYRNEAERLRECATFVAALDAMDRGDSGDSLQYDGMAQGWYYQPVRGGVYFGKTRFAAFRAAQDHHKGGPDDGQ